MTSANDAAARPATPDLSTALAAAPTGHAVFEEERKTALKRLQHFLHAYPTTVPFIVLLLGVGVFSVIVGGRFFQPFNLSLILQQVTIIGIVGIAQTLIILTAGIDLSVGAIMVLSSVVMGRLAVLAGVPIELAFALGLLVGIACGFINGALVTWLRLPPFIVTLGTWSIFGALNLWYSNSTTIRQQEVEAAAPFLQFMGTAIQFGGARLTYGSILMLVIAAIVWYMLNRTAFGRHIHAAGDDPDAARLAGINTSRTLLAVYTIAGLICAVAGWVLIGRIGAISALSGVTANLDSITAVVIGGTSLFGGRGSIVGTLVGRADRGRVPQRPGAGRGRRGLAGVHDRPADHRRGHDRPVDPAGFGMSAAAIQPILSARDLVKRFGRVTALDHADFDLMPGEILGVIGDNGAGKSTLIKAISGAVTPDHGEIRLDGQPVHFRSPMEARAAGIETVYQHLALVAGALDRRQSVSRPRAAQGRHPRPGVPGAGSVRYAEGSAPASGRARAADDPEHPPGGRDPVRWPAPGRGRGAGHGVRQPRRHHGRADRGTGRQGIQEGARADAGREAARACRSS